MFARGWMMRAAAGASAGRCSLGRRRRRCRTAGLDTAILLTHAYLMIADLCRLYRLRTNRAGTLALTWRIVIAAFVAGRVEDLTDAAADQFAQLTTHATSAVSEGVERGGGEGAGQGGRGRGERDVHVPAGASGDRGLRPLD
ncbi:MAG: hypothetical protein R3B49_02650 [Phycisphaerales bacterium]